MYLGWDVGIKNLSYCLIDYNSKSFNIIDWGIINLLEDYSTVQYCNQYKKGNVTEICGKTAGFRSSEGQEFYCKVHSKNQDVQIEAIPDKICCSIDKCKKNATRHDYTEDVYYCGPHVKTCGIGIDKMDLLTQTTAAKTPLYTLGKLIFRKLDKNPNFLKAKYICIENQPAKINPTMKSVQMILYSYFISKVNSGDLQVNDLVMMSARNKLKIYKNEYGPIDSKILNIANSYQKNKKQAVFCTQLYLKNEYTEAWCDFFDKDNKTKRDDLADAYLMCRYYICRILKLI